MRGWEGGEEGLAWAISGVDKSKEALSSRVPFFFFPTRLPDMGAVLAVLSRYPYLCEPTAPLSDICCCPLSVQVLPSLPPSCTKAHFLTPYVPASRSGTQYILCCLVQSRSHESAKKATLRIRFVIVGGGPAGLACAVALRRVGHHIIVLEKGPDFVGVRTIPVPFKLAP
jgi:hypothetical protein